MANDLTPDVMADLRIRRRQVNERYNLGTAQMDWQSRQAQLESGRAMRDITEGYGRARERVPYGYASRGLLNSGLYSRGLWDLGKQFANQVTDTQGRLQGTLEGFNLAKEQLARMRTGGLSDLDEMETARLAMQAIAESIRAVG